MEKCLMLLAVAAVVFSGIDNATAQKQSLKIERMGLSRNAQGELQYSIPSTRIVVDVTVKTETVKKGPYARFAQNYLGIIAPLSDKVISEITGVKIYGCDADEVVSPLASLPQTETNAVSLTRSEDEFLRVLPDRLSSSEGSAEFKAQDAANTIYSIRKHRMELITGDAGENVFGAGLKAALDELDRLENEYLSLFLGKTVVKTETFRYVITPEKDKAAYVVCRFADDKGIMPQSDLSGQPVVLDLKGEGAYDALMPRYNQKDAARISLEKVAVADNVTCRVMNGTTVLAEQVLPVFQFGGAYEVSTDAFATQTR